MGSPGRVHHGQAMTELRGVKLWSCNGGIESGVDVPRLRGVPCTRVGAILLALCLCVRRDAYCSPCQAEGQFVRVY